MRTKNLQASSKIASATYARIVEVPDDVVVTKAAKLLEGDLVLVPTVGRRAVRRIGDSLVFTMPRSGVEAGKIGKTKSYARVGFVQGGWSPIALAERTSMGVKAAKVVKASTPVRVVKGKKVQKVNENAVIVKALRASAVVVGQAADLLERLG